MRQIWTSRKVWLPILLLFTAVLIFACRDRGVAIDFDGTGLYHCSDCVYFDRSSFTVYDVNTAKARGLTPCEYCHSAEEAQ